MVGDVFYFLGLNEIEIILLEFDQYLDALFSINTLTSFSVFGC